MSIWAPDEPGDGDIHAGGCTEDGPSTWTLFATTKYPKNASHFRELQPCIGKNFVSSVPGQAGGGDIHAGEYGENGLPLKRHASLTKKNK